MYVTKVEYSVVCKALSKTYNVHECEDIVLHVLLAVKAHHGVVHSQKHLNVVVVCLCVPPLPLGLRQFMFHKIQSCGKVCNPKIGNCEDMVSEQVKNGFIGNLAGLVFFILKLLWHKFHMRIG